MDKDDELFDLVNDADEVIGTAYRGDVHRQGLLHRAVFVWVFNADGAVLLQRRSPLKKIGPSLWDLSVAEHVQSGESFLESAVRGLDEELGVKTRAEELAGPLQPTHKRGLRQGEYHDVELVQSYRLQGCSPEEIILQDGEVAEDHKMFSHRAVLLLAIALLAVLPAAQAGVACKRYRHNRFVPVRGTAALNKAVRSARPGTLIYLMPGRYSWLEVNSKRGTPGAPITICGSRGAVFDGSANKKKIMINVFKSTYVNLAGFTIQNALKGIQTHYTTRSTINGVRVHHTEIEAIHLARWSSYNTITHCHITHTGRKSPGKGEGVYIGSDDETVRNDKCVGNRIIYNLIGPYVTGDPIDIKQNSANGLIMGNRLDGTHLCGCNSATSLINVKGNGWRIINNSGKNSIEDMFKTATTIPGQARYNYFSGNKCMGGLRRGMYCVKVSDFGGGNKSPNKVGCGQMRSNTRCSGK